MNYTPVETLNDSFISANLIKIFLAFYIKNGTAVFKECSVELFHSFLIFVPLYPINDCMLSDLKMEIGKRISHLSFYLRFSSLLSFRFVYYNIYYFSFLIFQDLSDHQYLLKTIR